MFFYNYAEMLGRDLQQGLPDVTQGEGAIALRVAPQKMSLRSYQRELVEPAAAEKNVVIVAPTGTGKTFVAAEIAKVCLHEVSPPSNASLDTKCVESLLGCT